MKILASVIPAWVAADHVAPVPENDFGASYQNSMNALQQAMSDMNNMFGAQQQPYNPYAPPTYYQPPSYGYNPYPFSEPLANPYAEPSNPYPSNPYAEPSNPYAEPSNPYAEPSNPYAEPSIDVGNVNGVQVDCWANITDRINYFFRDKFPKLPNGESQYYDIEILNCYGCWCNREQFFGRGMGEPRDAFDMICKYHHQAYECISIDAAERGEVCDPTAVSAEGFKFKMELSFDNGRGGMNLQCDQNQSWCKQRVCEADLQYIKDFVRTALAGHRIRRDLLGHEDHLGADGLPTGYFDHGANCPLGGSLHTPHKYCCGAYPRRRTYKTDQVKDGSQDSYRECCDLEEGDNTGATEGAVFYPASQVCCGKHGVQNGDTCSLYDMTL